MNLGVVGAGLQLEACRVARILPGYYSWSVPIRLPRVSQVPGMWLLGNLGWEGPRRGRAALAVADGVV